MQEEDHNEYPPPPPPPPSPSPPQKGFMSERTIKKLDLYQAILDDIRTYTEFQILPIAQQISVYDIEQFFDTMQD
jgi:hypothetical protein